MRQVITIYFPKRLTRWRVQDGLGATVYRMSLLISVGAHIVITTVQVLALGVDTEREHRLTAFV